MKQKNFSGNAGQSQRRNKAVLSALPLPLLLAAIVLTSFFMYASRTKANERRLCGSITAAASRSIATSLAEALDRGKILSDALSQNGSLGEEQIADLSARILGSASWVSGVTTAPNAIIKYHYPEEDNDSAIGHDMLSNPDRSYALTLAASTRAPVISGPYESVGNKRNFFIRYPVFHKDTLWGFTSVTIDYDAWIKSLDLEGTYPDMSFAISRKQDDYSSTSDLQANVSGAIVQEIPIQGGAVWLLQAKPTRGWSAFDPFLFILLAAGLMASVLLFLTVYGRARGHLLVTSEDARHDPSAADAEGKVSRGDTTPLSTSRLGCGAAGDGAGFVSDRPRAYGVERAEGPVSIPSMIVLANGERIPESPWDMNQPAAEASTRSEQAPQAQSSHDPSRGSEGESRPGGENVTGDQGAKGDSEPAEQPEYAEQAGQAGSSTFKGSDVPGKVFMPESPVKGNFASLFRKVVEQVAAASESQTVHTGEPEAESASEAQTEVLLPGREPPAAPDKKRSRTTQQEMLFPVADEPSPEILKSLRKTGGGVSSAHEQVATARQNVQTAGDTRSGSTLSVLVVDDSEANRDIMDHMLEFHGHRPDLASSGEQALDLCARKPYDLIFMDCFMPGLDGYKTAQMIRSRFPDSGKKIIGMSARLGEQELRLCLDAGMDDLLAKPFTLKELDAIIKKHGG